jgi:hypothetical protein
MKIQFSYCCTCIASTLVLDTLQHPAEANRGNSETWMHKKGDLAAMASEKERGCSCVATDVHVKEKSHLQ